MIFIILAVALMGPPALMLTVSILIQIIKAANRVF
jgi:hypothetical protein